MIEASRSAVVDASRSQFLRIVGGTAAVVAAVLIALSAAWDGSPSGAFVAGVGIALLAAMEIVRRSLRRARATDGSQQITIATWVTVVRGGMTVSFAGFLAANPPSGVGAWVPAGLFATAALLDAVDGAVARHADCVSELGGILDTEVDALLVALGAVTAVVSGSAPVIFLAVGFARYLFVAGIRVRRRRGLQVTDLDPSQFRRATGAVIMSTTFLALLPVPGPGPSKAIAWAVSVPVLGHFAWDWLAVSGGIER
jgi:CDP-diacylglycerol--glycerol-3-phosphate 3-phosphatidyltransferase